MATTILRVKRRLDENPADALIIHSKKAKIDENGISPSVFVFSSTIDEKENNESYLKNAWLSHRDKRPTYKSNNTLNKRSKEKKFTTEHRMKVINYTRGLFENNDNPNSTMNFALVDLHHSNHKEDSNQKYEYDLYFSQGNNDCIDSEEDFDEIHPVNGNYLYSQNKGQDNSSDSEYGESDEDSNDENNWRNEYPDTDESINENDMMRVMQNVNIGNDLSTDEDDDNFNDEDDNDDEEYVHTNSVNQDDVNKYGSAYAKYKSKVLKVTNENGEQLPTLIKYDDSKVTNGSEEESEESYVYPKYDDADSNLVFTVSDGSSSSDDDNSDYSECD